MTTDKQLEHLYGPAAPYSEHKRGETIRYRDSESREARSGPILWVCAAKEENGRRYPVTYIVAREGCPDLVYPGEIIEEKEEE